MNFDLDDPLEGLLSDGSNDSLFGNETTKKPTKTSKPGKMEDLFGIKTSTATQLPKTVEQSSTGAEKMQPASLDYTKPSTTSTINQPSSLTSMQGRKSDTPASKLTGSAMSTKAATPQKKEISFDDSDLLADLGFDPKKPKTKSSILDDILGGSLTASTKEIPPKSVMAKPRQSLTTTLEEPPTTGKAAPRQSLETSDLPPPESTVTGSYAPSGGNTAPSSGVLPKRSGRRKSSVSMLNDPLGLFASTTDEKTARAEVKQAKKAGADWLGLNDDTPAKELDPIQMSATLAKPREATVPNVPVASIAQPPQAVSIEVPVPAKTEKHPPPTEMIIATSQPIPIIQPKSIFPDPQTVTNTLQIGEAEAQSAIAAMQQQEFQLSVAGQMKTQEQALIDMQQKQQAILKRQEAQFNDLLQKQMQRHTALEEVLAKQQQRINANIQLIMSQPTTMPANPFIDRDGLESSERGFKHLPENSNPTEKIELQTDVKRLEMEKLRLEDMVSNLSANHEQELSILESSYKKQMIFLEDSLRIIEARLKHDNKQLEEFYRTKLSIAEQEREKLVKDHEAKVQSMEEQHRKVIEQLKQGYEESLEQLRQDHREMIATIRESKMLEFSIVQENESYLKTLKSASSYLENASGDLQQLRDTLQEQIEFSQKEKELQLKHREKQLEDQQRLLERSRVAAAEENVRLLNLVETLESKVTEMTKISSEERWEYQQKCIKLEAEKQSLDKEKQFLRDRQEREESRIAELKQTQLEEHARLMDKVAQERQTLSEEKAKLETIAQLTSNANALGSGVSRRAEVDAALKVAEEAARQADSEKDRYLQLQRQLESKRREMQTRESKLREAKEELESAIDRATQRERHAESVYRTLRKSEQNMQLKMQLVQRQFREVSEREDRLAKEKIEFSKERMELQAARRKMLQTRCSLCKIGDKSQEIGDLLTTNTDSVADDLKLEANFAEMQNRLDSTAVRLDHFFDSDVDRQMKLFLERNQVELGEDTELTSQQRRRREIDRDLALLSFDALFPQLRSGEGPGEGTYGDTQNVPL
ncbi:fas-binding factor 1 [Anopheles maculipalpis]|uniref:fas-binding factor 1 n=1 Tax=Anopheles maculipalpis TaxID=1496333 RepID=UPI00215926A9|nr:fas-binding factor 1 [Anopheles maculipalpis]